MEKDHTYQYQIGLLYFGKRPINDLLVQMLELDGYRVGIWHASIEKKYKENSIELYKFIKNQCENMVFIVFSDSSKDPLFTEAFRIGFQRREVDEKCGLAAIECENGLLMEFYGKIYCLQGGQDCSGELAIKIERYFYGRSKDKDKKVVKDVNPNVVIADVITGSRFF